MKKLLFLSVIFAAFLMYQKHIGGNGGHFSNLFAGSLKDKSEKVPNYIKIENISGEVFYDSNGELKEAQKDSEFLDQLKIITYNKSYALISFGERLESQIKIGPNSNILIKTFPVLNPHPQAVQFNINYGNFIINAQSNLDPNLTLVEFKNSSLSLSESIIFLNVDSEKSAVIVNKGNVTVTNKVLVKNSMIESGKGIRIDQNGQEKILNSSHYQINWNENDISENIINHRSLLNNFLQTLNQKIISDENLVQKQKEEYDELRSTIAQSIQKNEYESASIEKDIKCLEKSLKDCVLESIVFKNNINTFGENFNIDKKINKKIYETFIDLANAHIKASNDNIRSDNMKLSNLLDSIKKDADFIEMLKKQMTQLNEQFANLSDSDAKERLKKIIRQLNNPQLIEQYQDII